MAQDPRALLIRAAEAIPAEYHAEATREAILDAALSMACGMLEGLLDPDPVLAGLAARMYRARLEKLETDFNQEITDNGSYERVYDGGATQKRGTEGV